MLDVLDSRKDREKRKPRKIEESVNPRGPKHEARAAIPQYPLSRLNARAKLAICLCLDSPEALQGQGLMTRKATTCLRCDAEMAEGWLLEQASGSTQAAEWVEDPPKDRFWPAYEKVASNKRRIPIQAYRCPNCSHVELFANWSGPPPVTSVDRSRSRKRRRNLAHASSAQGELTVRTKRWVTRFVESTFGHVSSRTLFFLDHRCKWCRDQILRRAEPHWVDYPLVIVGLRHYYCPHCFVHCYRFKKPG